MDQAAPAHQAILWYIGKYAETQIWIAASVYAFVPIVKKRLNLKTALYTLLQILPVTLFEKISLQLSN
jgi:hypothetical protein